MKIQQQHQTYKFGENLNKKWPEIQQKRCCNIKIRSKSKDLKKSDLFSEKSDPKSACQKFTNISRKKNKEKTLYLANQISFQNHVENP